MLKDGVGLHKLSSRLWATNDYGSPFLVICLYRGKIFIVRLASFNVRSTAVDVYLQEHRSQCLFTKWNNLGAVDLNSDSGLLGIVFDADTSVALAQQLLQYAEASLHFGQY